MLDQIPAYIQSNLSFFSIMLCGVLAATISYFLYRRSVPPLPTATIIILASMRGIAVALILILLFAPEITFIWQKKMPVKIGIAVDKSGSMALDNRIEKANEIKNYLYELLNNKSDLKLYKFDLDTATSEDEVISAGDRGTDISSALSKIAKSEFEPDALILISDGNFTTGQNPVYTETPERIKIYTIGVGDTSFAPDLVLSDVQINKVVYQNKPTVIQAEVQLYGMNEARSNVVLLQGRNKLDAKQIENNQKGITVPVRFELIPDKVGVVHYQLAVQALAEEKNRQNNEFYFTLNVLKGQLNIGIVAQKPDPDPKFLKIMLDHYNDIKVNLYIPPFTDRHQHGQSVFYPDSMDVLMLFNMPPDNIREKMRAAHSLRRIPVITFLTTPVKQSEMSFLKSFVPINMIRPNQKKVEYLVKRTKTGRLWPVLNNYAEDATNTQFWAKCPPIYFPFANIELGDEGNVVLGTREENPEPVLYKYTKGGLRGGVFFGSGFWRWHFLLSEDRQFKNAWAEKVYNMIRWITSGSAEGNVVLTTLKQDHQAGEPIRLNVQVYDGAFKPVTDATVQLRIRGAEKDYEVEAELSENLVYQGYIPSPGTGTYRIEAQAWRNDVNIGSDSKEIYVSPVNAEYLSGRQDYNLLQTLAKISGAKYTTADSLKSLVSQLDLTPRTKQIERSYELWYRLPILLAVLVLFSTEWYIRKRKGLA
jgi:hypothetical protein